MMNEDVGKTANVHGNLLTRSLSDIFPRRRSTNLKQSTSHVSIDPICPSLQNQHIELGLNKRFLPVTRFAFTDLVVTVLRLDFYCPKDEHTLTFCIRATEILLKWGGLPQKTQNYVRLQIEECQQFNEDIGALITVIKSDPLLEANGLVQIIGSFLISILADGDYDSRFRILIRHISALLSVHWDLFESFESTLSDRLIDEFQESMENQQTRERKSKMRRYKRYAMIGAASGLGGVLIGVTGGLAAPLIISSVTALTATTIFTGLTATAGAAIFGSLFGAAGAGLSGYRMRKRVGEIDEFVVERLTEEEGKALHCILCVSGWVEEATESRAFHHHWRHLWMSKEQYTLRWESKYLEELGKSIEYFVSFAVSYAIQRSLMETVLASLVSAIAWPLVLLGSSSVIDNPWNICTRRAAEAGEHLAEVLLTRAHGRRPITLIGYSLGARVIYHCLLEMSKRKPDSLGIIEDIILLGAPVSASPKQWRQICSVVGGRVINGYCKTDWLLRFLYRTMSIQFIIAGTGPVENKKERKIVNFNLSHIVKGHLDYAKKLTQVLEAVGVRVTPLSQESTSNLEQLDVKQEHSHHEQFNKAKMLDGPSVIVEEMRKLSHISRNEEKEHMTGPSFITDPLGADESTSVGTPNSSGSFKSIETFHSTISSNPTCEEK